MWSSQWTWPPFTSSFKHPKLVTDVFYANVFRKWGILQPKHTQIGGELQDRKALGFSVSKSLTKPDGFHCCKRSMKIYTSSLWVSKIWDSMLQKHAKTPCTYTKPKTCAGNGGKYVCRSCISVSSWYGSKKPGWTATPKVLEHNFTFIVHVLCSANCAKCAAFGHFNFWVDAKAWVIPHSKVHSAYLVMFQCFELCFHYHVGFKIYINTYIYK